MRTSGTHQTRIKRPRQLYHTEKMRQNERYNEPPQFTFTRQKNNFSEEIINHLGHLNMDGKIDDKMLLYSIQKHNMRINT